MVIAFLMMNPFHHRYQPQAEDMGGEYNGYVAFSEELPLSSMSGADWDDEKSIDYLVSVHGGITLDENWDFMKNNPFIPLTSIPDPKDLENFRVIGFDTVHSCDTREKWPIERVKEETLNLKKQIEKLIAEKP